MDDEEFKEGEPDFNGDMGAEEAIPDFIDDEDNTDPENRFH